MGVRPWAVVAIAIPPPAARCGAAKLMRPAIDRGVNIRGASRSVYVDFLLEQVSESVGEGAELVGLLKHREAVARGDLLAVAGGEQDRQLGESLAKLAGKL